MIDIFDIACCLLGIPSNLPAVSKEGSGKYVSEELIKDEFVDTFIVVLLSGKSSLGDPIWSYVEFSGINLARVFESMRQGLNFKPSDLGTVLMSGIGSPPCWVTDIMRHEYNMQDPPIPKPLA